MKRIILPLVVLLLNAASMKAQNVGINTSTPAPSAALDIVSSSKGMLIPRMNTASRNGISSPARGLMVYDSTVNNVYLFNGAAWTAVGGGGSAIPAQSGNAGKSLQTDGTNLSWEQVTPLISKRTTTQLINASAPAYTGILSVNLEAGKTYLLSTQVFGYRAGATSAPATFRLKYSGTASTDLGITYNGTLLAGTSFNSSGTHDLEAAGSAQTITAANGQRYELRAYITTTTSGTFTIETARTSANTANDFYISAGSYLIATPLQ